ncbi:unnamed protein product [Lupinus luteus]|uniref:Uncharacterized protein n=1 Tax=Lupinus luteus TaxID=3873 RepID=A0AAV1YMW1_LUPLU
MKSIISETGVIFQGDRTRNVGIVDHEYVVHKGIQTLGGSDHDTAKIRRQSTWELEIFKERWNQAIADDKHWIDPFTSDQ